MNKSDIKRDASCRDDFDPASILPERALAQIFAAIQPVAETESVPLRSALGRVLAADIRAGINVPSGRNSAMDGYAINAAALPAGGTATLRLVGASFAGQPFPGRLGPGECARIMTGALMPAGADSVIMQEEAETTAGGIRIGAGVKPGDNVREAGEDLARGDRVLAKGARLAPADLGVLASVGLAEVEVSRNIKVAFFSTGDELRPVGEPLADGLIYDSNRYTLYGMLARLGVQIIDLGIVRDDPALLERAFLRAEDEADIVITSGGVSVGEADYVKETLRARGEVAFWKVAMKPGRPLTFGRLGRACFFGLPGNPVSVMVTFYQFVQPAIRKMLGETIAQPITLKAPCASRLKKRPGRIEYQRGILSRDKHGRLAAHKTGAQDSGILSSMAAANCFIVLPLENDGVEPGDMVDVQLFHGLV